MMIKVAMVAAAACLTTFAVAQTPSSLLLTAVLYDGDRIVGEPRLKMAAGEPVRIVISERPNELYDLTVNALPGLNGSIITQWSIHARSASGDRSAVPTMSVLPDHASSIAFGEESATTRPFRVDFKLSKTN